MANNVYIKPGENRAYLSSAGTNSNNASRIEFRAFDEATIKATIYELNSNLYLSTPSGTIYLGDGTPANVELGASGTPVDLDFLGGGTITANGNTLDFGISGDTINLNVSGVSYLFPSLLARDNEVVKLSGNQTITGTKTFSGTILGSISGNSGSSSQIATSQKTDNVDYIIPFINSVTAGNKSLHTDNESSITFNPSTNLLSLLGDLAVNGGDITTSSTDFKIGNTVLSGQTLTIAGAASTSGTKVLNLGTGGTTGSTTNINIGSSVAGTTTINSPTLQLPETINWNASSNFKLNQTANNQEWSFDIVRGSYTGGYFQVWDSGLANTLFRVDAVTGNGTFLGDLAVNGGDITTSSTDFKIGNTVLSDQTLTIAGAASTSGTKVLNLGTGGTSGSTTNINIGSAVAGTTTVNSPTVSLPGNLTVGGNLIINGSTVTQNSTTVTIDDPIFTLGGDTAPTSDDNKDRGIEFRWFDSAARIGFFGFDDSSGYFTFIPSATNSSEVFSGTPGTAEFLNLKVNGTSGSKGIWTNTYDYLSPLSHSSNTWLRNASNTWTLQGGNEVEDWTKTFQLYLQPYGTAGANDKLMEIGQRVSNATAGDYKGVKIVQYTGSSVTNGYLETGTINVTGLSTLNNTLLFPSVSLGTFDPPGGGSGADTATNVAIAIPSGAAITGWNDGYIRNLLKWTASGNIEIGQGSTTMIGGITMQPGTSGGVAITSGATTGSGLSVTANSITSGDGVLIQSSSALTGSALDVVLTGAVTTGDAAKFQANSYVGSTTSGLVDILSTSTGRADGSFLLYAASSGANANAARNVKGAKISVTNTGTTSTNTALELTASGASSDNIALNITSGRSILQGVTATTGNFTSTLNGLSIGVDNTNSTTGRGLSLYGGATAGQPTYGMMFAGTSTFGTYGPVTGDWATYLTVDASANRGWIFKTSTGTSGNVASISNTGAAQFSGNLKIKSSASEIKLEDQSTTSSGTMRYNSTTKSLEFIFA